MWMVFHGVAEILVCEKTAVWTFSECFEVQWQNQHRLSRPSVTKSACRKFLLHRSWSLLNQLRKWAKKKYSHPLASIGDSTCVHVLRQTSKFSPMVNDPFFFTANDWLYVLAASHKLLGMFCHTPFSAACRSKVMGLFYTASRPPLQPCL